MAGPDELQEEKERCKTSTLSRMYLSSVTASFTGVAANILVAPISGLALHNLDLSSQPASGLAEVRAAYCGTLGTLAWLIGRGALSIASREQRRDSLAVAGSVLGIFSLGRAYSFVVDGAPNWKNSYIMWGVELAGALVAFGLHTAEGTR
eukprot:gnl/TRDRNA2_/TRDRNA2_203087_c0_seq1.p1 gnl/TRDRNA2_/TRDRNA2_203087_c0~~gnl/TRDRNA2_/TRDRNA2_203087_c0_seq1.p1  ORF type:complete len:167 (+),score=21.91 gnl/TRDRNA2_/TRDRNA2_203087_c0_seq1:53-502(+)